MVKHHNIITSTSLVRCTHIFFCLNHSMGFIQWVVDVHMWESPPSVHDNLLNH